MPQEKTPDPEELASRQRTVASVAEALGVPERSLRERAEFGNIPLAWRR